MEHDVWGEFLFTDPSQPPGREGGRNASTKRRAAPQQDSCTVDTSAIRRATVAEGGTGASAAGDRTSKPTISTNKAYTTTS
jgi:hypothetical protein